VQATDIINGIGEATAYLAVATDASPKELAKDLAQYGQQFQLAAGEYLELANLFAKIRAGAGLESGTLIEGSKYFQLRAGAPLGLKGIQGARQGALLMASVKELGLEGTVGGTGLSNFFSELAKKKKLDALRKNFGIDLNIFDKKGNFLGVEQVFSEMEKFRKLSTQQQINALNQLGGDQGMAAGMVMIQKGAEGWQKIVDKVERASDLQSTINVKTETFNSKLEAVLGTGENLVARTFTPLLNKLKPAADGVNTLLAGMEGFAKSNPALSNTLTSIVGLGSTYLVVSGGIGAAQRSLALWRMTGRIAAAENAALSASMRGVGTQATVTALQIQTANRSLMTDARTFGRRFGTTFMRGVGIAIAGVAIADLITSKFRDELDKARQDLADSQAQGYEVYKKLPKDKQREFAPREAAQALEALNQKGALKRAFNPSIWESLNSIPGLIGMSASDMPYARGFTSFEKGTAAEQIRKLAPSLGDVDVMRHFIAKVQAGALGLDYKQRERLLQAAEAAFPQVFKQAEDKFKQLGFTIEGLNPNLRSTSEIITGSLNPAIEGATKRLNLIGPVPNENGVPPLGFPSRASGGDVLRNGLAYVHRGEMITPANVTPRFDHSRLAPMSAPITLHYAPVIEISPGQTSNLTPASLLAILDAHAEEVHRIVTKVVNSHYRDRLLGV
jgi:TP901 family phage tail tape measure protein